VPLDDALADCKPDAVAGVRLMTVQALEHFEDALNMTRIDSDSVVDHEGAPPISFPPGRNVDADLTILAKLSCALARARGVPLAA
jgi:hypothetical protein